MLGERIRALRMRRGWKQRDLAEKAGVTPGMISHIERGEKEGSIGTINAIAAALSISPGLLQDPSVGLDRLVEISAALEGMSHLNDQQLQVILQLISTLQSS